MRDLIFKRMVELLRKPPVLNKFFVFNLTDLNDDPEGCIEVIEDFLEKHKDKVKDIRFDTWIDEETFLPVIKMEMHLTDDISSHLMHSNLLNNLIPSSDEEHLLRERITRIISKYGFEFNTEDVRKSIAKEISWLLSKEISDDTTNEDVDSGGYKFSVSDSVEKISLDEYLKKIKDNKRFEE